ncbi:MAG: MarR family winged helix-turn-helix transcriptional regulator [Jatrophihabitans sp.]|uniref:MarR family winged helix-turn-helix transcriptional regulator n=1 Tax=Jatrophihabitans sp. TaxID=1932789 RepID=UPI003F81225D
MSDDAAVRVWTAMRTLVLDRNDRRAEVAARLGMSFVRVKALRHVAHAPMTMRELAALLAIDAPYTTVVVDDLAQRDLVERRTDPADRRRKIVVATAAGKRLARTAQRMLDVPPPALAGLPADDLAALDRILSAALE